MNASGCKCDVQMPSLKAFLEYALDEGGPTQKHSIVIDTYSRVKLLLTAVITGVSSWTCRHGDAC